MDSLVPLLRLIDRGTGKVNEGQKRLGWVNNLIRYHSIRDQWTVDINGKEYGL